jgi:hypothetical protein
LAVGVVPSQPASAATASSPAASTAGSPTHRR